MPRKKKLDPITGLPFNGLIRFYLYGRYLGCGFIPAQFSFPSHRREAARRAGIKYYNGITINGRDLRDVRITTNSGKKVRDVDFRDERYPTGPLAWNKSEMKLHSACDPPMSNKERKLRRKEMIALKKRNYW